MSTLHVPSPEFSDTAALVTDWLSMLSEYLRRTPSHRKVSFARMLACSDRKFSSENAKRFIETFLQAADKKTFGYIGSLACECWMDLTLAQFVDERRNSELLLSSADVIGIFSDFSGFIESLRENPSQDAVSLIDDVSGRARSMVRGETIIE